MMPNKNTVSTNRQPTHWYLWLEMLVLFFGVPVVIYLLLDNIRAIRGGGSFLIFLLPTMALLLAVFLFKQGYLSRQVLFSRAESNYHVLRIVVFFIPFAVGTSIAVWVWQPENLFSIPQQKPLLWLLILVFYPLLSVLSQGIIYRVFFFIRYQPLFSSSWLLILTSAICFSFGHIIFGNYIAPLLTFFGGLIFAWRYHHTQSWLLSSFEHALYGCWLFSVGLGQFLYSGA